MTRGAGIKITLSRVRSVSVSSESRKKVAHLIIKILKSIGQQPEIINNSKKSESCLNNRLLRDEKKKKTDIFVQNFKDNLKKGRKK